MNTESFAVPRLYKLGYLEMALLEIAKKAPFERLRQALLSFAQDTGEGQSLPVVSRLGDQYAFWSPTQEALSELMRLGFVVQQAVPSGRNYVDSYRTHTYELTIEGTAAVEQISRRDPLARANYLNALALALVRTHHGFADFISAVTCYPLCIPEYTIQKIGALTGSGSGTQHLAEDAISRMTAHWPSGIANPSVEELTAWIKRSLDKRFPPGGVRRPSQKDILDTVDDAVVSFAAQARNIRLDAISFNVCSSWAGQLAILDESRYVEDWLGRTVWSTATIDGETIKRRGFNDATDHVIQALREGFIKVAESRFAGFMPIYRVRAQAAFSARVNLRFVDKILDRLLLGEIHAPYKVQVALGRGTAPPRSEPIFVHQGRRFFDILLSEEEV